MRKLITILFLIVHSLNIIGYKVVSSISDQLASDYIQATVDRKLYADTELVSIKVPFSLPYFANSPAFEAISGKIEVKGVSYEYVKRRFYNDSLEVLCLPNFYQTSLNQKKADLAKDINTNGGASENSKKSNSSKSVISANSDYYSDHSFFTCHFIQVQSLTRLIVSQHSNSFYWVTTVEQPPEA